MARGKGGAAGWGVFARAPAPLDGVEGLPVAHAYDVARVLNLTEELGAKLVPGEEVEERARATLPVRF